MNYEKTNMNNIEEDIDKLNRIKAAIEEMASFEEEDEEDGKFVTIEFWTDTAGQDVIIQFNYDGTSDDFMEQLRNYVNNYDPNEETKLYSENMGQNGVPDSIETILEDCEEARATMIDILNKCEEAYNK